MSQDQGETVLITGASSGIGLATALYMAERGYSVIGTSRSIQRLAALQSEAADRGLRVSTVELDINSAEAIVDVIPRLIDEHEGIEVLVNNAAYGLWGPSGSISADELGAQFETNFFAPFRLIEALLPGMVEKGKGTIVNVSSILGRIGVPFNGAYCASKYALEGLSESMRVELWPLGVRVVVVEPGYIRTNFHQNQVIAAKAGSKDLPHTPHARTYRERLSVFERMFSREPIKVARVIHKAVQSRRPRFRYAVGFEARLGIVATKVVPERLFQALLSRATLG